ncbi:transposase [Mesorhizobium sp. M0913]
MAPGAPVSEVARRHDIHPNMLHLCRRRARARDRVVPTQRNSIGT